KDIEKLIRKTLERSVVPGFEPSAVAAPRPEPQPRGPRQAKPQGRPEGQRRAGSPQHRSGSRHR
ncbi:MAG TPA: hypothetical protein PLW86_06900, partial [Rhodocyclaceae bacterium]|nr:hypothetical protein [Rhodocyclaceae bacterium]